MFADDIKLYRTIRSSEDCLVLQNDINILLDWSNRCLLSFNILKCKVLYIGNAPYTSNYTTIAGIQLELLDNIRDLGIQIDSKLKFHIHTDMVVKKAYRILGIICKLFECKDTEVMVRLYKTLFRPIVEYNNVICDPVCEKGSYSLSNCIYMVTHNLTGEYGTSLQFGHSTTLTWQ